MKKCTSCKQEKTEENFTKNKLFKDGLAAVCKLCTSIYQRNVRFQMKEIVFRKYGNRCACCGESDSRFLTIDHINNDGYIDRNTTKSRNSYAHIVANGFPKDLQIFCWNCNCAKQYNGGGSCPHIENDFSDMIGRC